MKIKHVFKIAVIPVLMLTGLLASSAVYAEPEALPGDEPVLSDHTAAPDEGQTVIPGDDGTGTEDGLTGHTEPPVTEEPIPADVGGENTDDGQTGFDPDPVNDEPDGDPDLIDNNPDHNDSSVMPADYVPLDDGTAVYAPDSYDGTSYDATGYDGTGYDSTGYDGTGYDSTGYDGVGYDTTVDYTDDYNDTWYDDTDGGTDSDNVPASSDTGALPIQETEIDEKTLTEEDWKKIREGSVEESEPAETVKKEIKLKNTGSSTGGVIADIKNDTSKGNDAWVYLTWGCVLVGLGLMTIAAVVLTTIRSKRKRKTGKARTR